MFVTITTYGVLHGPPPSGDALTVDLASALRNPHHDPGMRHRTGLDPILRNHVLATPGAEEIVADTLTRIRAALEHTPRLDVHIYCRGGRHRSVAVAEEVARRLRDLGITTEVTHRDIRRPVVASR